jgi:hypothetical protein
MATSQIKYNPGTVISFKSSGGDATFTPTSVAAAAGRVSAVYDRGAGVLVAPCRWQGRFRSGTNAAVGGVVRVYLITGEDGTYQDAQFAAGDAAVAGEDVFRNATMIGMIQVDVSSTTKDFVKSGLIYVYARYVRVAFWNATSQGLSATAADMEFTLKPMPDEAQ